MAKKILFLIPYPLHQAPSQRFRFEQYFDILEKNGCEVSVQSFLNSRNWHLFFQGGNFFLKVVALLNGFFLRFMVLFQVPRYHFVFIHREASPVGPPLMEWIIARILKRKIIYDFDDAIWQTDRKEESMLLRLVKWRSKVRRICRWSYKISCGNNYLCTYAHRYNRNVILNPTTLDTAHWHNPELFSRDQYNSTLTIGWTGTHSTLKYLKPIEHVLQRLEREFPALRIMIIANQKPGLTLSSLILLEWNAGTEVKDLLNFDIGIMPLPDEEWSKGKCGFKILQYLALEIPAVASPVGVNVDMITNGKNGYLCTSDDEWYSVLKNLIENETSRKISGKQGREFVRTHYSVISNSANFLRLFE